MLDMGFKEKIIEVTTHSTLDKEKVQTLMFSATFPEEIQRLAGTFLRNYIFLTVGIVGGASTDVEQEFFEVGKFKKRGKLTVSS
jgi:probable ATP-dependent RNA helicase DDX4